MVWRDDPTHEFLNRLVTVTFIDLTNCDEDDFASDLLPIEVIDLGHWRAQKSSIPSAGTGSKDRMTAALQPFTVISFRSAYFQK